MNRKMSIPKSSPAIITNVPPSAIPIEEAVLGALLIDREAFFAVEAYLRPETFYLPKHGLIFQAIRDLSNRMEPVDLLTVTEELRRSGKLEVCEGGYYLVELSERVASAANLESHARILHQYYMRRELIALCHTALREAYRDDVDPFDTVSEFQGRAMEIGEGPMSSIGEGPQHISDALTEAMKEIDEASKLGGGLTTGLREVDEKSGGFFRGELTAVAARPGMGKTEYALKAATANGREGKHVWFVSLEMTGAQLCKRIISELTGIEVAEMRKGSLSDHQWEKVRAAADDLRRLPIKFCGYRSPQRMYNAARKAVQRGELDILFVDYLQLMEGDGYSGNREQEVSKMSRKMKMISKDFQIPVVMLSQLSREVEKRADRKPVLSDLRETGSIEQDCDNVQFLYRPEYYGITELEIGNRTISSAGVCLIIAAKQRHASLFLSAVRFEDGHFGDLNPDPTPGPALNHSSIPATARNFENIPF